MITFIIHKNTDTPMQMGFVASGKFIDISALTRITITLGDLTLDSIKHPNVFDWITYGTAGRLDVTAGHVNGLKEGIFKSKVTVYDATYPNGFFWDYVMIMVEG